MARPRAVPSYRRHKQSGQAVVTLTDPSGERRDVLLGKYGTSASRQEYARVLAEWETAGRCLPAKSTHAPDLCVSELILAFMRHAEQHYRRPDGTLTSEVAEYRLSLRPVKHLYCATPARDFGPLSLKAVRDLMVKGWTHPKHGEQAPLSRGVVNQRIGRIRRVWKWGVENEQLPPPVLQGLQAVRGLQRGRTTARETEPVRPVANAVVEETLPYLTRHVAGLVRLLRLTGMRCGEACVMRACDIDTSGAVWLYRPNFHKTAHHGHRRIIALGPQAQAVVREFLTLDTQAFLFSPVRAQEERYAAMRSKRKTPVQPSQQCRKKRKARRLPGERYKTMAVGHAICKAIDRANTERACEACKLMPPVERCAECRAKVIPHWHPHQLRHSKATEIRREYGLDVARVVLGHRSPQVTELYAEIDMAKAAAVMEKLG
jgi:integrase